MMMIRRLEMQDGAAKPTIANVTMKRPDDAIARIDAILLFVAQIPKPKEPNYSR